MAKKKKSVSEKARKRLGKLVSKKAPTDKRLGKRTRELASDIRLENQDTDGLEAIGPRGRRVEGIAEAAGLTAKKKKTQKKRKKKK